VRAGLDRVWCVVKPQLSSLDRLRLAISENQMREDFTQADRVAALDALQALEEDAGLRGAARALGILPVRYMKHWPEQRAVLADIHALAGEFRLRVLDPVPCSRAVSRYSLAGRLWHQVADELLAREAGAGRRAA
jgi:hypothetical protein